MTIESAEYAGYSNNGQVVLLDDSGERNSTGVQFLITIAARASEAFLVTVPINAPQPYAKWYQASGLCQNNSLDLKKVTLQAGFTATGGRPGHPSHAGIAVSFKTSDGHVVESQANWDDPVMTFGPTIKLPPQVD